MPAFFELMDAESDEPAMRIVHRIGDMETAGFEMMDLYAMNRVEDLAERFIIRLEREFKFGRLEAEKFADYAWNWHWVLVNMNNHRFTTEQALPRIMEQVDLSINEMVIGERGA